MIFLRLFKDSRLKGTLTMILLLMATVQVFAETTADNVVMDQQIVLSSTHIWLQIYEDNRKSHKITGTICCGH